MPLDEFTLTKILDKHFDTIVTKIDHLERELGNLRGDVQQEKTASRAAKKRDWRIIRMIKAGR